MTKPKLTIGMAVYDDLDGVWSTVQALRLYHHEAMRDCEIVVVDNNPTSRHGHAVKNFMNWVKGDVVAARYVGYTEAGGTTQPRNHVFAIAEAPAVMVIDSHVLIAPGAIKRLIDFYDNALEPSRSFGDPTTTADPHVLAGEPDRPRVDDFFAGPMIYDDLVNRATHLGDEWRGEMWGTWQVDDRGGAFTKSNPAGDPFEIGAMGLGLFSCRKDAWLGFNPKFRGFGGEEWYIQEKYRRAGRKAWCLPWLMWNHRFGRPDGVKYPLQRWDRVRNYVIGLTELGIPLDRLYQHFVASGLMKIEAWNALVANPENPPLTEPGCGGCGKAKAAAAAKLKEDVTAAPKPKPTPAKLPENLTLEQIFDDFLATKPLPIVPHMVSLRELASTCENVTEFGASPLASTVAILAGRPAALTTYANTTTGAIESLKTKAGSTRFTLTTGDPATTRIEPTDMLLLDYRHNAKAVWAELSRNFDVVKRYIVVAGSEEFGTLGDVRANGGVMNAVRRFVHDHKEWSVVRREKGYGVMILSRDDRDKTIPPGTLRKALNFSKALAAHAQNGMRIADDATYETRLDACLVCEHRYFDSCGKCGCPVDKKASWAEQQCPDDPPRWMALPVVSSPATPVKPA